MNNVVPPEIKVLNQWVMWKYEDRDGRKTKIPYTTEGYKAESNNPETWTTYNKVIEAFNNGGGFDGIGFMFSQEDEFTGVDWDHVRNKESGEWEPGILEEIQSFSSYAEISPSGEGAHVICIGEIPGDKRRKNNREMYDKLRYFTFTGDIIEGAPLSVRPAQKAINKLYRERIDPPKEKPAEPQQTRTTQDNRLSDDEIIRLCKVARNGEKFKSLWNGSTAGYPSHSEADQALCSILAFYTQDEIQIDNLFRQSGLYRDKWRDRRDYRERTINAAIDGLTQVYEPESESLKKNSPGISGALSEILKNPLAIAETLQDRIPIHYDSAQNYWKWNPAKNIYERIDETDILCEVIEGLEVTEVYRSKMKSELMECIRITGRSLKVKEPKKSWIQFKNKVIDIHTGEEFNASPDYFFAACIPHRYGNSEETPTIDRLFTEWVGHEYKQLLYEICAYCLYDGYPIHRIFTLIGGGRNGKSQFMKVLNNLVGNENIVSTELDRIANSMFETSKFYKKKVAFIGETNFNTLSRTNILKQLSDGSPVPCEFKRKDCFDFENTAKIIIATNGLPATTDRTEGFYRRWLIIDFPNKFKEGRDVVAEIPQEEYDNLCRKCVTVLRDLLDKGSFTMEGTVEERAAKYEQKSNPVNTFVTDCCEVDSNCSVPTWYLFEKYQEFAEQCGYRKFSQREFSNNLKNLGYEIGQKWHTPEEQTQYGKYNKDRKNWQAVFGLSAKFIQGVGDVGDVGDVSSYFSPIENQVESSPTSPTSPTPQTIVNSNAIVIPDVMQFCNDWQIVHQKLITRQDVIPVAMEYCSKRKGQHDVNSISNVVRHFASIPTEEKEVTA